MSRLQTVTQCLVSRSLVAPLNTNEQIEIVNESIFQSKLATILSSGPSNVQLVTDFDYTFSKYYSESHEKACSSYGLIENHILDSEHREIGAKLTEFYHPIEIDPTLSYEEKLKCMDEWWNKANENILSEQICESDILRAINDSNLRVRYGTDIAMRLTQEMDIPMTIVSAGVGNVVSLVMQSLMDCSHVEILSNFLYYDEEGKAVSFSHPSINSLTKFKILANKELRPNIILLGDVTPDAYMLEGATYNTALKIGFVNDVNKYDIQEYRSLFDVLILNDGNFCVVEALLAWLEGKKFDMEQYPFLAPLNKFSI